MNILQIGKKNPATPKATEHTYQVTCPACRTLFEFAYHEGKYHRGFETQKDYLEVACPMCFEVTRVSTTAFVLK